MNSNVGLKIGVSASIMPISIIINGFVLMKIWEMFIVTTLGLPPLTIVSAAGLTLVINFIFSKIDWDEKMEKAELSEFFNKIIAHNIVTPFLILLLGYILSLFL